MSSLYVAVELGWTKRNGDLRVERFLFFSCPGSGAYASSPVGLNGAWCWGMGEEPTIWLST